MTIMLVEEVTYANGIVTSTEEEEVAMMSDSKLKIDFKDFFPNHSVFWFSSRQHRHRSRSRSRSRTHPPIDKKKLLEIARKNAISMLRHGTLPRNLSENTKEKLMAKIRHGGQSIEELTNYCKRLSKAEDLGELSGFSDSDNDGDGNARPFHHPFEVKDRGPIVMNIRVSARKFIMLSSFKLFLYYRTPCQLLQSKRVN